MLEELKISLLINSVRRLVYLSSENFLYCKTRSLISSSDGRLIDRRSIIYTSPFFAVVVKESPTPILNISDITS